MFILLLFSFTVFAERATYYKDRIYLQDARVKLSDKTYFECEKAKIYFRSVSEKVGKLTVKYGKASVELQGIRGRFFDREIQAEIFYSDLLSAVARRVCVEVCGMSCPSSGFFADEVSLWNGRFFVKNPEFRLFRVKVPVFLLPGRFDLRGRSPGFTFPELWLSQKNVFVAGAGYFLPFSFITPELYDLWLRSKIYYIRKVALADGYAWDGFAPFLLFGRSEERAGFGLLFARMRFEGFHTDVFLSSRGRNFEFGVFSNLSSSAWLSNIPSFLHLSFAPFTFASSTFWVGRGVFKVFGEGSILLLRDGGTFVWGNGTATLNAIDSKFFSLNFGASSFVRGRGGWVGGFFEFSTNLFPVEFLSELRAGFLTGQDEFLRGEKSTALRFPAFLFSPYVSYLRALADTLYQFVPVSAVAELRGSGIFLEPFLSFAYIGGLFGVEAGFADVAGSSASAFFDMPSRKLFLRISGNFHYLSAFAFTDLSNLFSGVEFSASSKFLSFSARAFAGNLWIFPSSETEFFSHGSVNLSFKLRGATFFSGTSAVLHTPRINQIFAGTTFRINCFEVGGTLFYNLADIRLILNADLKL